MHGVWNKAQVQPIGDYKIAERFVEDLNAGGWRHYVNDREVEIIPFGTDLGKNLCTQADLSDARELAMETERRIASELYGEAGDWNHQVRDELKPEEIDAIRRDVYGKAEEKTEEEQD